MNRSIHRVQGVYRSVFTSPAYLIHYIILVGILRPYSRDGMAGACCWQQREATISSFQSGSREPSPASEAFQLQVLTIRLLRSIFIVKYISDQ